MADGDQYKRFGALNVILADGDPSSAQRTRALLSALGVYQLRLTKNYAQLVEALKQAPADLIVFDAGNKTDTELDFLQKLRKESSTIALTPVLTLSPNTTEHDVRNLVNIGTTELVAKPVSIKTLFGRFQNMVDSPRSFVCTKNFKGPDRRRKQQPGVEGEGRTGQAPKVISREDYLAGEFDGPVTIAPDFTLKVKVNNVIGGALKPEVEDEFIFWSLSDISAMEASYQAISEGNPVAPNLERICSGSLGIEARSEAYGYELGSEVARRLGKFCRHDFTQSNPGHIIVIEKHLQTLSTVYHGRLRGDGGETGKALIHDLGLLVKKYLGEG